MEEHEAAKPLVAVTNLREFFHDSVQAALRKQRVDVDDHTEHYVVNVLTMFARSEELYESTPEGIRLKPLARMLADAADASSTQQRDDALRRLGDVSLFVAGFFAQSFARKLIDIDYHIAMGGRAYGTLADNCGPARARTLRQVFAELAAKFVPVVDALNEISESSYQHSDRDRLRLYELWVKTGSERSRTLLRKLGIEPAPAARTALVN